VFSAFRPCLGELAERAEAWAFFDAARACILFLCRIALLSDVKAFLFLLPFSSLQSARNLPDFFRILAPLHVAKWYFAMRSTMCLSKVSSRFLCWLWMLFFVSCTAYGGAGHCMDTR
jgi:hypothetical protein